MAVRLRRLVPDVVFRAGWSSGAFLLYIGAYVIVASLLAAIATADEGQGALVGWSGLATVVIGGVALALLRAGETVPGGLLAVLALIVFGLWVGLTESWIGLWPEDTESFVPGDFEVGVPLLALLLVAVGLVALRVFRFPLLVLPIAVAAWYGLVYLVISVFWDSPGETAHGLVSFIVGLGVAGAGVFLDRVDRPAYAFWLHVVGGAAVMGGLLAVLHDETWEWALIVLASIAFVVVAVLIQRSSYTVIGALSFLTAGDYFVDKWFSAPPDVLFFPIDLFGFALGDGEGPSGALATIVLGAVLFVTGLALESRWRPRARSTSP